jgi:hypothetical protein
MNLKSIGFWSSIACMLLGPAYVGIQMFSLTGIIQLLSHSSWLFALSVLCGFSFLSVMVCMHMRSDEKDKIFTTTGILIAGVICIYALFVFFTNNAEEDRSRAAFLPANQGFYLLTSVTSFFASFAFRSKDKWLYRALLWNSMISPFLILSLFYSILFYAIVLWLLTFCFSMIRAAKFFSHKITVPFDVWLYEYQYV